MKFDKNDGLSLTGSILFHLAIAAILFFTVIRSHVPEEDGGVLVNFGNVDLSAGTFEPQGAGATVEPETPVAQETPPPPTAAPAKPQPAREETIVQDQEESVALANKRRREEAEKRRRQEDERRRREQLQAETDRKNREAAEQNRRQQAIRDQVANAFGSGSGSGSQGEASRGSGNQGNPFGNSDRGAATGTGGAGGFSLSGRSLRGGGLPAPAYTSQVEGRVVVDIVVDPEGNVINASIGKGTNIDDSSLRNSALSAARRAKFNRIQSANNQSGSITYNFVLR